MKFLFVATILICSSFSPLTAYAQTTTSVIDHEYLVKASVLEASEPIIKLVEGTNTKTKHQTIKVQVLEGPEKDTITVFENTFTPVHKGDLIYVRHQTGGFDSDTWAVSDPYRINVLIILGLVFLALTLVFGGIPGIRGLASLAGSLILIFTILLPGLYAGYSPILLSIGVASLIIIVGSYVTHGINKTTTSAVLAMIVTVLITGAGAYYAMHSAQLSGFTTEENSYLNFGTEGKIDMFGLLFGGIMIGLLGVLYDIAIGQAIAVEELLRAGVAMTKKEVYVRAIRIGREHIGALITILAIAYVGSSLPILLLFHDATASVAYVVNSERFATEIIRILIGSIGLILAVPITTFVAIQLLDGNDLRKRTSTNKH